MFSSSGRNLILGRMNRMMVLQTGSKISIPSTLKTKPAPRDIQTEYWSVLRPARRGSAACFHLLAYQPASRQQLLTTASTRGKCVPSISEDAPVEYPKKEMEEQFRWRELLLQQCEERHLADWFPLLSPYGERYINVDLRLGCRRLLQLEPVPGMCGRWPRRQFELVVARWEGWRLSLGLSNLSRPSRY